APGRSTLSLHDALPIWLAAVAGEPGWRPGRSVPPAAAHAPDRRARAVERLAAAHRRAGQPGARRQAGLPLPRRTAGTGAVSAALAVTLAMMPAPLAALVRAELAAGNEVVEVGRAVRAPSVIAFVKLAQPVTTRPRASGQGVVFEEGEGALRGGAFRDDAGRFFVLETCAPAPAEGALERFRRSMAVDYEKWHDGVGYDLAALRAATARERQEIEALLLARGVRDWRDVEALAALDSDAARHALRAAFAAGDPAV